MDMQPIDAQRFFWAEQLSPNLLKSPWWIGHIPFAFELIGRLRSDNTGFDATFSIVHRDGSTSVGTVTVLCDPAGARGSEVTTVCALSG